MNILQEKLSQARRKRLYTVDDEHVIWMHVTMF